MLSGSFVVLALFSCAAFESCWSATATSSSHHGVQRTNGGLESRTRRRTTESSQSPTIDGPQQAEADQTITPPSRVLRSTPARIRRLAQTSEHESSGVAPLPNDSSSGQRQQRRPRRPGSTAPRAQRERQQKFDQIWEEEGLSTDLSPTDLADRILRLRKKNIMTTMSLSKLAMERVTAKGDPAYKVAYLARMTKLSEYLGAEMAVIRKDRVMSKLPLDRQLNIGFAGAFKNADRYDKKRKRIDDLVASSMAPMAFTKEARMTINRVGKIFRDHVRAKGLNFRHMSLVDLEEVMKLVEPPQGMDPGHFRKTLYRSVQYEKGLPTLTMEGIKQRIRNESLKAWKKQRDAQTRQQQQQQQQ